MRTKIYSKLDEKLSKEWAKLWKKAANSNMFNSPDWFLASKATYPGIEYRIHTCYENGKLVAVMPVSKYRKFGIKVAGSIANDFVFNTPFLIARHDMNLLKILFNPLISSGSIYMTRVHEKEMKLLNKIFPGMFITTLLAAPYIKFQKTEVSERLKNRLKDADKIIQKQKGKITSVTYSDNLNRHLETMFRIDRISSKKFKSRETFSKEINRRFYKNLIKYCRKFININVIYFKKTPFVHELGFNYKKSYVGYQTSFLSEYKHLSPGKLMYAYLINKLRNEGVEVVDLGGGISFHKEMYTNNYYLGYDLYHSNNNIVNYWWKIINSARRAKQIIFPDKYSRDHEFLFKPYSPLEK
jgi:CelD/BcsL family acetyltransferase involved in cellulose biosynthesis